MTLKRKDLIEIDKILCDIKRNPKVKLMKTYNQHGKTSTYLHCKKVAEVSYKIDKVFKLNCNKRELLRGAMLHDFFLYDWHITGRNINKSLNPFKLHGFVHPELAKNNAEKEFTLSKNEKHIIETHMWPLTLRKLPMSREAWVVTIADKYCSIRETIHI